MKQITNASFHTPHNSIRTLLSNLHFIHVETRDSSVSTVLGYGPNDSGLDFRQGGRDFCFAQNVRTGSAAHPASY